MGAYILRRLLLLVPTLFGIIAINFAVAQLAPGGPVEQAMAEARGRGGAATERITGATSDSSTYRGGRGLDAKQREEIIRMFGFDKPAGERFMQMLRDYLTLDFGRSFFKDQTVLALILQKMPVSVSLGLWSTLLIYLVSIPRGIAKAVRDGSRFDVATSGAVLVGYAIPGFLFAILLVVLFAGGSFLQVFPLRGLTTAGRALDRVLLRGWYLIPHYHNKTFRIATWDRFGRPEQPIRDGFVLDSWWIDPAKAARVDAGRGGK